MTPKLNTAIGLLAKIRYYTPKYPLKTYFTLFNLHLIYARQIREQFKSDHLRKLGELQDKALRTISFLPDTVPLIYIYIYIYIYKISKKLKLPDYIGLYKTQY